VRARSQDRHARTGLRGGALAGRKGGRGSKGGSHRSGLGSAHSQLLTDTSVLWIRPPGPLPHQVSGAAPSPDVRAPVPVGCAEKVQPTVSLLVNHSKAKHRVDEGEAAFDIVESIQNQGLIKVFKVSGTAGGFGRKKKAESGPYDDLR
jgi:hypothetical protein